MFETIRMNPLEEKTKFFNAIENQPISSVYTLGNLYLLTSSSAPSGDAQAAINQIKQDISQDQTRKLEKVLIGLNSTKLLVRETTNRDAVLAIKKGLLQDKQLFSFMSNQAIIKLGQDLRLAQLALIALVRKHVADFEDTDPFETFDYQLLSKATAEQACDLLTPYLVRYFSLPFDKLLWLGQKKSDVAKIIMFSLDSYDRKFDLAARFAVCHPSLRQSIADNWQSILESSPLTEAVEANLRENVGFLIKENLSEFNSINEAERMSRYQINHDTEEESPWLNLFWATFGVGAILGVGVAVVSVPVSLPVSLIGGGGAFILSVFRAMNPPEAPNLFLQQRLYRPGF